MELNIQAHTLSRQSMFQQSKFNFFKKEESKETKALSRLFTTPLTGERCRLFEKVKPLIISVITGVVASVILKLSIAFYVAASASTALTATVLAGGIYVGMTLLVLSVLGIVDSITPLFSSNTSAKELKELKKMKSDDLKDKFEELTGKNFDNTFSEKELKKIAKGTFQKEDEAIKGFLRPMAYSSAMNKAIEGLENSRKEREADFALFGKDSAKSGISYDERKAYCQDLNRFYVNSYMPSKMMQAYLIFALSNPKSESTSYTHFGRVQRLNPDLPTSLQESKLPYFVFTEPQDLFKKVEEQEKSDDKEEKKDYEVRERFGYLTAADVISSTPMELAKLMEDGAKAVADSKKARLKAEEKDDDDKKSKAA